MIVVDTSALIAILRDEPLARRANLRLAAEDDVRISAATLTETLIVASRRGLKERLGRLIETLELQVAAVDTSAAQAAAEAYERWGKGVHPAGLNFADCFAYALASTLRCPLLFVGNDFARTDVVAAI